MQLPKRPGKTEVNILMEDGIPLKTSIFLPRGRDRCPAVLVRTPYDKGKEEWMGKAFGMYGIAVVIQDVRGRFESGGDFYPFLHERTDGLSTLRWIREQPWSNGVVTGWGASYVGYTQWAISDSLDFLVPFLTGANLYDFAYPDGVLSLQSAFVWSIMNAPGTQQAVPREKIVAGMQILPLSVADDSTLTDIQFLTDWFTHEHEDAYWQNMNYRGMTKAPFLSVAGWYDIFLKTQIEDFQVLIGKGSSEGRMIIGPWCHGSQGYKNEYGGTKKTGSPRKLFSYTVNTLKGKKGKLSSPLKDTKYNLFIMERNEYIGSEVWPPRETRVVPYFLGQGNTLLTEAPVNPGDLSYIYDPSDPFPSLGGTALGDSVGPALQNRNLSRKDQLAFETEILEEPMILLGPVSATLWLSSDVRCTAFVVCLQDVFPDGKIVNIQEGIAGVELQGTGPEQKEISVWATGYQLNPGHRLKVVVTSSWFPRFNRSLNGCEPIYGASHPAKATQKVYFGSGTPSCINLPVFQLQNKRN